MVNRYRYSEWDGTQEIPPLDPDEVLESLTDDLMNFGDLQHALRNLLQRGMRNPMGQRMQGLRDLLQQLRQQRRQTLDKFNLSSVFDDIKQKLNEIVDMEKETIDRRTKETLDSDQSQQGGQDGSPESGGQNALDQALRDAMEAAQRAMEAGEQGDSEQGQPGQQQQGQQGQQGQQQSGPRGPQGQGQQSGARSQQGQQGQSGQQGGQQGQAGESGQGDEQNEFAKMLQQIADRKRNFLENLPSDLGGAVKELQNYEFMDPEAQAKFGELMEMLK